MVGWLELGMRARGGAGGARNVGKRRCGVVPCALVFGLGPEKGQRFGGVYGSPIGE